MMRRRKVVAFDLDDTLYKEIDFLRSAFRHIASRVSDGNITEDELFQLMLDTYQQGGNAFEVVLNKLHCQQYSLQWMLDEYRYHNPRIALDDDTRRTLGELKSWGMRIGIISDGRFRQQMNKIEALGLKGFIDDGDIVINADKEREKPDRRSFSYFMDKYGKDVEYMYVGDNPSKDFIAPNQLGWTTVCLLDNGQNIHGQDLSLQMPFLPRYRVKKLSEILGIVL